MMKIKNRVAQWCKNEKNSGEQKKEEKQNIMLVLLSQTKCSASCSSSPEKYAFLLPFLLIDVVCNHLDSFLPLGLDILPRLLEVNVRVRR